MYRISAGQISQQVGKFTLGGSDRVRIFFFIPMQFWTVGSSYSCILLVALASKMWGYYFLWASGSAKLFVHIQN